MKKRASSHFPLLSEFMRGYLHQDLVPEYGNAQQAAHAYLNDLDDKAKLNLAKEVPQLRTAIKDASLAKMNAELARMGSQWNFDSAADLNKVLNILEQRR